MAETSVAIYAVYDILGTPRMKVMVHHEIQQLAVTFSDLIHELRERYTARDQAPTRLTRVQLPQMPIGVPYYQAGRYSLDSYILLGHYGPFLASRDGWF